MLICRAGGKIHRPAKYPGWFSAHGHVFAARGCKAPVLAVPALIPAAGAEGELAPRKTPVKPGQTFSRLRCMEQPPHRVTQRLRRQNQQSNSLSGGVRACVRTYILKIYC